MAFRFALAPLLRLRQSIERQRTLSLQEASLQLAHAQETLARLERFLADSALADSASLATGRTAAELQFASLLRDQFRHFRHELQEEVRRLEALRKQAVQAYQQAFREREVLESSRASQRRVYQLEQGRRQQKELDAAHLLQRWHHRDG
jgi:flagellar export protein FliJ